MGPLVVKVLLIAALGVGAALPLHAQDEASAGGRDAKKQTTRTVMVDGVAEPVYRRGSKGITPPKAILTLAPEYPQDPKAINVQGTVMLSIVVTSAGEITDIHVIRGLGFGLDESATKALRSWKCRPAMKDGKAVSAEITIEQEFRR